MKVFNIIKKNLKYLLILFNKYLWGAILIIIIFFILLYLINKIIKKCYRKYQLNQLINSRKSKNSIIINYCTNCRRETFWYVQTNNGNVENFYCLNCKYNEIL